MLSRRAALAVVPPGLTLPGCPPRVRPSKTPILQPVPPPGTPVVEPLDAQLEAALEQALVVTFHEDRAQRDADRARELLARNFAPAWGVQGYTDIDQGLQLQPAIERDERVVQADEACAPAHDALASSLTRTNPEDGKKHFQRAMELDVQDQRRLGERFHPY